MSPFSNNPKEGPHEGSHIAPLYSRGNLGSSRWADGELAVTRDRLVVRYRRRDPGTVCQQEGVSPAGLILSRARK